MRIADVINEMLSLQQKQVPVAITNSFYDRAPHFPFADYITCADSLMMDMGDYQFLCKGIVHVYH